MALGKALKNGPPREGEYAPGGDPDAAFYAGALFAYQDAAARMGEVSIHEGDFDRWLAAAGFSPVVADHLRLTYQEAYGK